MAAALNGDVALVERLLPLATNPMATDRTGRTALHYAIAAGRIDVVEILLPTMPNLSRQTKDGRNAVTMALEQPNPEVLNLILDKLPSGEGWTADGMQILKAALATGRKDLVKQLLAKYSTAPVPAGKSVPLLAYEIASGNIDTCKTLLDCGVDPNTVLPDKCDADFLALLAPRLRGYIDGDKGVTMLTLASGLGQCDTVRALLATGADRNRATTKYKMLPLYVAAQTGKWQCAQILLGGGPSPDVLRIEISL
jgi:ankyrin repeat protein